MLYDRIIIKSISLVDYSMAISKSYYVQTFLKNVLQFIKFVKEKKTSFSGNQMVGQRFYMLAHTGSKVNTIITSVLSRKHNGDVFYMLVGI